MIKISDLHFEYPQFYGEPFRLSLSSLRIEQGEQVVLYGPSGCGKSTLLRLMAGELVPHRGKIFHHDLELSAINEAQRRAHRIQNIGFVFQDFPLVPYLSALENTLLAYRIHPRLKLTKTVRHQALSLLSNLGLEQKIQHSPDALSQGERQRVAIARALLPDPPIILADEPTAGLDPDRSKQVVELLQSMVRNENKTLVLVTHDLLVRERFDRQIAVGGADV